MFKGSGILIGALLSCAVCSAVFGSENGANDYLLTLTALQRLDMLAKVIGAGCRGQRVFYKGVGTAGLSKNEAFWDVTCTSGKSYEIEVHPDGSSQVLECSVLEAMHAGKCFKRF